VIVAGAITKGEIQLGRRWLMGLFLCGNLSMPYVPLAYLDDPADCAVWRYMNLEKSFYPRARQRLHPCFDSG